MSRKELIKKIEKKFPGPSLDITDPKAYRAFCKKYGKAITPALEAVDRHQARSMEKAFTKVIR